VDGKCDEAVEHGSAGACLDGLHDCALGQAVDAYVEMHQVDWQDWEDG
jgi:hypothetical protein